MSDIVWVNGISEETGYSRYDDGLYDSVPEGWEILEDADWAGSWEYDQIVVWRNLTTGEIRAAWDEGCSCPNPFAGLTMENTAHITSVDDLRPLVERVDGLDWDGTDAKLAEMKARVHRALRDGVKA